MSNTKDIYGQAVLVVDDDYFLAMDACTALKDAGATVLGPFSQADEALASLAKQRPNLALVDLNLGSGPDFNLTRSLAAAGISTLILTGYDKHIIPPDLTHVPCLQKPVDQGDIISALRELLEQPNAEADLREH
jgi:DNA-binding NarL/FixJ family response regulator